MQTTTPGRDALHKTACGFLALMFTGMGVAHAATYYVSQFDGNNANDGLSWGKAKATIQAAVTSSVDGDTIWVDAGIYDPITTGNKTIVISSFDDTLVTAINGNGMTRCATLGRPDFPNDTNTVLRGFILINGYARDGGGSYGGTLIDCHLINNNATYGGGSYGGVLGGCWLVGNEATQHGGGAYGGILFYSWLDDNTASRAGGGTYESTLYYCELIANKVYHTMVGYNVQGGGAYGGTLNNCFLQNNYAFSASGSAQGGGAWGSALNNCFVNENSVVTTENNGISCGGGTYGGTLSNCTLVANVARATEGRADGGGAWGGTLNWCIVEGNLCGSLNYTSRGGGAYGATLNHCVLVDNTAAYGQLEERASDIVVALGGAEGGSEGGSTGGSEGWAKSKTWSESHGSSFGSGWIITGTYNFERSEGGSEETNGSTTWETNWSTTFENNWYVSYPKFYTTVTQSEGLGGGAYGGTLNNCVLWNNTAWSGGGAYNATLNNCTVVENTSYREGGGVRNDTENNSTVNNSIIVFNQSNGTTDTGDPVNPADYNSYNSTLNFSHVNSDPLFVDRAKQNFRLQPGSPCIDAGNSSYVTWKFDLDGNIRIYGPGVDKGAYEYAATFSFTNGSVNVIHSAKDLAQFAWFVNQGTNFVNTTNVLVSDIFLTALQYQWIPAGTNMATAFRGTFDGNGYTIDGLTINVPYRYAGLFGYIWTGGIVQNVNLVNTDININYNGAISGYVGGVAGFNDGGSNGGIINCSNSGTVAGHQIDLSSYSYGVSVCIGGVAGQNGVYGRIINCSNSGSVSATGSSFYDSAGGIVGFNNTLGSVRNCSNSGTVTSSSYIASGIGDNGNLGIIENCLNSGTVTSTGNGYAGGVSGINRGTIRNCANSGAANSSSSSFSGGVVGQNSYIIEYCYWKRNGTTGFNNNAVGSSLGPNITINNLVSFTTAPGTLNSSVTVGNFTTTTELLTALNNWVIENGSTTYWNWKVELGVNEGYPSLVPMYTITFNAQGGSVSPASKSVTLDFTYAVLPIPTRTGYTFTGWFTSASGGTQVTDTTIVRLVTAHTLYAQWTQMATLTTPCLVPFSWLDQWGGNSGNYETLAKSKGLNGYFVWESFVADLIPTDANSKFLITNLVVKCDNGKDAVATLDWTPHRADRVYTVWGKTNLMDTTPWYTPTNSGTRFFKVEVKLE